jgi:DNA-binding NarL/FixJ family response regulator
MSSREAASQHDPCTIGDHLSRALGGAPSLLIVSDVRLVREGIAQALGDDDRLMVVATAAPELAQQSLVHFAPNVVLLDMRMPGALETARGLRSVGAGIAVVALGAAESDAALLACAVAGVTGFVGSGATASELAKAVQGALRGELVCSPRMAGMLLNRVGAMAGNPDGPSGADALTLREHEIAILIGDGLSNKQIALALGIRNATVKNHVHNILGKLRLARRSQVGAWLRRPPATAQDAIGQARRPPSGIAPSAFA